MTDQTGRTHSPRIPGVMVDCPRCDNPSFYEMRLCRPEGVLRCSWCGVVVKKDARPLLARLIAPARVPTP